MRYRWLTLVALLGLLLSVAPAAATVTVVDPFTEPEQSLEPAEVETVAALQSAAFPQLFSEISPDDQSVFVISTSPNGFSLAFVNVQNGAQTPISEAILDYGPLTEIVWRDARTATYLSLDADLTPILVNLDADSGELITETLGLPPSLFPISLAPNASRLLVAEISDPSALLPMSHDTVAREPFKLDIPSPFNVEVKRSFDRPGPAIFDADAQPLQMSETAITLASYDLESQELVPLLDLPPDTIPLFPPAWTQDGSKVAFARTTLPNFGREGTPLSDVATQDTLGQLPPDENPFFQGNVVDVFDIAQRDLRPEALRAADGNGDVFARVQWSPDGQTLLTQMQRPARLVGREYPTYLYPDRSYLRFYDAGLQQISAFDRPEIEAPTTAVPIFVSPDEVIINAPYGLSYRLFYFNRVSGEFRQISLEDGTYYQMRTTRQSRQVVFNFSSFGKPYDLYRIGWDGQALAGLTYLNYDLRELNRVRADQINFTLRNGQQRRGYLIQPADAPFPPQNVPIVAWQEGGPGLTITNQWGTNVENPYNLLSNLGVAVLVVPLPGREGWGPAFYNALADGRNYGQIDIDEQAEIMQQLIAQGYTSGDKIGITGCSYGGYFTSQSITRYPDLYAAANTQCTLLDLFTEWQLGYTPLISYLEGRIPTADPAEYTKDSPGYNATKVRTPLLIFHGTEDFLPITITRNFHDQIEANGSPVRFLQFANEGHGLIAPTSQLTAAQAQISWFREYLGR